MEPSSEEQKTRENGAGPMVGIVIIVLVLLIGGLYFLFMETASKEPVAPSESQALLR